ncbi:MAG: hypothetical protein LC730_01975 [Acidobacteria bacterium]|nr:hypothetical protein [Acidobacteriota bacterium]MCA1608209.1 hypothetical protein [Acidobacteriota bacterium]
MTTRWIFALAVGVATLATGIVLAKITNFLPVLAVPESVDTPVTREQNLSGPFTHKNLTIYLVHGENRLDGKTPLILEEAMIRDIVIVHETGEVSELAIENVSKTDEVFVQAGDIVKGGKQDRVLAVDLIVPARSGKIPIDAFCVENGRWQQRGGEKPTTFAVSTDMVASKDLKMAAKATRSQSEVWNKVAETQSKLGAAMSANVNSAVSRSSLQLSLEHSSVRTSSGEYIEKLSKIIDNKPNVIGFVFAINGKINSADTYASSELFRKLWPKLLKAAAIEAVAESFATENTSSVAAADVSTFLAATEAASHAEDRTITDRIKMITRESATAIFLETLDGGSWLHRNYILK